MPPPAGNPGESHSNTLMIRMPRPMHPSRRTVAARPLASTAAIAWIAFACGCGGSPEPATPTLGENTPGAIARGLYRLDAAWNTTIVAPRRIIPEATPEQLTRARLDDGRPVRAEMRTLTIRPTPPIAMPNTGRTGWLAPMGEWLTTGDKPEPGLPSGEFVIFTIPPGALGQGIWLGDRRLSVVWLPPSISLADQDPTIPWGSPLGQAVLNEPAIQSAALEESRNPFRRWRARLLAGRLVPTDPIPDNDDSIQPDRFEDASLEAIASQVEERWRVALARLWQADQGLAAAVRSRLVAVLDTGAVVVPAWPTDQASLDQLLHDLLDPGHAPRRRAALAREWLDAQPGAVAMVLDDAAGRDASGLPIPAVLLGNLSPAAKTGFVAREETPPDDLTAIPPYSSRRTMPSQGGAARSADPRLRLRASVAEWSTTLATRALPIPARPPGLIFEPLQGDLTLRQFLGEDRGVPPTTKDVAVTLIRTPSDTPLARHPADGWQIYAEFSGARGPAVPTLRIWTGPSGKATPTLTLTRPESGSGVVRADLPRSAASGEQLLLGVEFTDASGEHYAWPRPMTPWQFEPGRIAIDLAAWGGITRDPPTSAPAR